jgi:hypothetical protein
MRRAILLLTAALLTLPLLAACGGAGAPAADLDAVKDAMLAAAGETGGMSEVSDADGDGALAYLAAVDAGKVDGWFFCYSSFGAPCELAVIRLKRSSDADAAEKALRAHVEDRVRTFRNYAPDQVAAAERSRIVTQGRCVALIMCDETADAVEAAFRSAVETR